MKKIKLIISFFKDCKRGIYRSFSKSSLVLGLIGAFYVILPIDFLPEWLPFVGLLDDAAVISLIYKQLNKELNKYKIWKED